MNMPMRNMMPAAWLLIAFTVLTAPPEPAAAADPVRYSGGGKCEGRLVEVTFDFDPEAKEVSNFRAVHRCRFPGKPPEEWSYEKTIPLNREGPFKDHFKGEDHLGHAVRGFVLPNSYSRGNLSPRSPAVQCDPNDYHFFQRCYSWEAYPVGE